MRAKKAFCGFKFRGMTDCSIPHPPLKDFEIFIFADRLRIREICDIPSKNRTYMVFTLTS